jgi:chaperonin GroES
MANYKPISDKVIIKKDSAEEVTRGGLIIPESVNQDIASGTVVAVGPGRWDKQLVPMHVKIGDKVYIGKYSGVAFKDKDVVVVREEEILAIEEQ